MRELRQPFPGKVDSAVGGRCAVVGDAAGLQGCRGGAAPSPEPTVANRGVLLEQALKANASGDSAGAKRGFEALLQ